MIAILANQELRNRHGKSQKSLHGLCADVTESKMHTMDWTTVRFADCARCWRGAARRVLYLRRGVAVLDGGCVGAADDETLVCWVDVDGWMDGWDGKVRYGILLDGEVTVTWIMRMILYPHGV